MIPVKITQRIYIRRGAARSFPFIGIANPSGNRLDMEGMVTGESIAGISDWYFKTNDNGIKQFYWGGGVTGVEGFQKNPFSSRIPALVNWNNSVVNIPARYKDTLGANVKVGVLDFGIMATHPDLQGNTAPSADFTDPDVKADDDELDGHGTHVAGLIAGNSTYLNGVIGVAPKAKLYIAKVIGNGASKAGGEQIFEGIDWLRKNYDPHIYNMSLGFNDTPSEHIVKILDSFLTSNRLLVAAAGDDGDLLPNDIDGLPQQIQMPANHSACISVGTVSKEFADKTGEMKDRVDIICPKVRVWSCSNNINGNQYYKQLQGSSMGAAFISGVVALILSFKIKNNEDLALINKQTILDELRKMSTKIEDIDFDDASKFCYAVN